MRIRCLFFLCATSAAAVLRAPTAPRRQVLAAAAAAAVPWSQAVRPAAAADTMNLDDGPIFIPSPSGIFRYALKKQTQKQEACYAAGECVDKVPYYRLECERGDSECLQRKQRLARAEINTFFVDPLSQPTFLIVAFILFSGPLTAVVRVLARLLKRPD